MTRPCPHCQQTISDTRLMCPHCGALALPPDAAPPWPPPPSSRSRAPRPDEPLLMRVRALDITLGVLLVTVSAALTIYGFCVNPAWLDASLPLLASPVMGYLGRARYPAVARGIFWAWAVGGPLLIVTSVFFPALWF